MTQLLFKGCDKMKERLTKLLTIKSIVTLAFTIVVAIKALYGQYDVTDLYEMIIIFYFGTQAAKE